MEGETCSQDISRKVRYFFVRKKLMTLKKLAICVNHSFPHIGGSEKVVKQISDSLYNLGVDVTVISGSLSTRECIYNGVRYVRLPDSYDEFLSCVNRENFTSILIYSDYFKYFKNIVTSDVISIPNITIVMVGANQCKSNKVVRDAFLRHKNKFQCITHSCEYQDAQLLRRYSVPFSVIPNGIDFDEFNVESGHFRQKHNLENKTIALCVSNFFPGKGQEHLLKSIEYVNDKNIVYVFISSSTNVPIVSVRSNAVRSMLVALNVPHLFLSDISRNETISAFIDADMFLFPSQKEVSPLVLLESMASRTPWVSLQVGNAIDLRGGIIVPSGVHPNGDRVYTKEVYKDFAKSIDTLATDDSFRDSLGNEGYELARDSYDWSNIINAYHNILF